VGVGGGVRVLAGAGARGRGGRPPAPAGHAAEAAPAAPARHAELARALGASRQLGRSVVAYRRDGETCRVMAVIGGDDTLGAVLLFHTQALDDLAVRTFERSSSVIGIVLLSQERMAASKRRGGATLLRTLVSPRQDELALMLNQAERHGVDLAQPTALLLVEMDGPQAGYAARRFGALTPLPHALVDDIDGLLVVLCGATRAPAVRQTVAHWARVDAGATHRGVLSRPVTGPAELPALYATLRRAPGVLRRLGVSGQVIGQNELALYSTLFETHDRASLATFLEATLGPLLAHDRKRGAELAVTLLSYLDHQQSAKLTAQRLQIHVNTVRQRLATIEDLLGPWGDASRTLEIHVALRLWRLAAPAA
ncbi:MAG: helix-turn-helix domain-containing protein, partial [Burkholderiaceae bacterium]